MPLQLDPMGTMTVYIDQSWFTNGPISARSCSSFREVIWDSSFLVARSLWGNGTYRGGPEIADTNIRVLFRTDDGVLLYLDYLVRVHLPTHTTDLSPAMMSGRIEVDEANDRYAWLNRARPARPGCRHADLRHVRASLPR